MDKESGQSEQSDAANGAEGVSHHVLGVGETFGNYRIVKCVSEGLMANYYHMQHVRDLKDVTVGLLHPRANEDPKMLKRLQTLQQLVNSIDEPGIPKIRDCVEMNGYVCLFTDPVIGMPLGEYFAKHNQENLPGLEPLGVARLCANLLGLLGCAHAQGLDHRDLDSQHIFVTDDGKVQVLGVGLKAALGVDIFEGVVSASISPLKRNDKVKAGRLTSFDVMSPEYKSGVEEDNRVDIFAVGLIGYWLLTGQVPNRQHLQLPSTLIDGLPSGWDVYFTKSLERRKEDRYQSCKGALLGLKQTEVEISSNESSFIQRQIDRIPVPKGVVERGDLATRVYRLSLIGLIGVTLTALMVSFFESAFLGDSKAEDTPAIRKLKLDESPNLQLVLSPSNARVYFGDDSRGYKGIDGKLDLIAKPGRYQLRVVAPGYVDQTVGVSIADSETLLSQTIELLPKITELAVKSEPAARVVLVDAEGVERELGQVDDVGEFVFEETGFEGTYDLIVSKHEYSTFEVKGYEIQAGDKVQFDAPLKALFTSLKISSKPARAQVQINGVYVGTTPLVLRAVEIGQAYRVVGKLEGYRSVSEVVQIKDEGQSVVDFGELIRRIGSVDVAVNFLGVTGAQQSVLMEDLEFELNGQRMGFSKEELSNLDEGRYKLQFWHPDYEAEPFEFSVQDQEVSTKRVMLKPKPGTLGVQVPEGVVYELSIDGKKVELVDDQIGIEAETPVELELRMQNYLTMRRAVELGPNETKVWEVQPVPIPGPKLGDKWNVPYMGMPCVWLNSGQYEMGSPLIESGRMPNEGPGTNVSFSYGFWMSAYEVTQMQYWEITGKSPSEFYGPQRPVDSITWQQALHFCELLTERESSYGRLPDGYVYRLPTEPEWEYGARAGTETPYNFGDRIMGAVGNFRGGLPEATGFDDRAGEQYGSERVGSFKPNAWGIYDIHGNVSEWTLDYYDGRLEGGSIADPRPRTRGDRIAVRGGSWKDNTKRVRIGAREDVSPVKFSNALGFRVVLAPEL